MNRKISWSVLCVIVIAMLGACGGGNTTPPPVETIVMTSGSGQTAVISTAFANPLVATVSTGATPNSGVVVTFTAPASGASGTFGSGATSAMATTDANGVATSPTFTANATAGGPYTVTAAASGVTGTANFSLTNTTTVVATSQFSFYLSGQESQFSDFYALAGSVTIDANGNVVGGEQDFNDGDGFTFLQDAITGGSLSVNGTTGQGTLTLTTVNVNVGVNGTETLGVQYVNTSHALITEFDASETSSGSLDLQTAMGSAPSGSFAFAVNGVASETESLNSVVAGGVFTISGANLNNGVFDVNDEGNVFTGTGLTGTVSGPDSSGRGTITATSANLNVPFPVTIVYYVIGPEAIRLIDMDTADTAIGSAFGQGGSTNGFGNGSLPASVFNIQSNVNDQFFGVTGQLTATAATAAAKPGVHTDGSSIVSSNFSGAADDNEEGEIFGGSSAIAISGTYFIESSGYGSLTIAAGELGDVSVLGVYMVDPNINVLDPNNSSGTGGALVVDLDTSQNGTGVLIPQTDTTAGDFSGNYDFGISQIAAIECTTLCQSDYLGQGTVTDGVLSGAGLLNDPLFDLPGNSNGQYNDVTYAGTAVADNNNQGRYTMTGEGALDVQFGGGNEEDYSTVVYQANGGQLLWMEIDSGVSSVFGGSIQQQGSLTGLPQPAAKKAAAKAKLTQK